MHLRLNPLVLLAVIGLMVSLGGAEAARRTGSQTMNAADRRFMVKAAQINIGEVKGGELAHTRAVNSHVRDYAQMLIEHHSSANNDLKKLAARKGVRLPNDTDKKHKAVANQLAKHSGAPFDRAYTRAMIRGHQDAIALFQRQVKNGRDPEVRSWASRMIPVLQEHLTIARRLNRSEPVQTGKKSPPGANYGINRD